MIVAQVAATIAFAGPYGAKGLAIASAVGQWVNGGLYVWYSRRLVKLPVAWGSLFRATALGLVMGAAALWAPGEAVWMKFAVAAVVCAAFPALLVLIKDPMGNCTRRCLWCARGWGGADDPRRSHRHRPHAATGALREAAARLHGLRMACGLAC